jgi:flagellar hook assembly protein FlgD
VRNLLNRTLLSGYHRITWDGRDDRGESVGSGVYRVLLRGATQADQQSVVLVR